MDIGEKKKKSPWEKKGEAAVATLDDWEKTEDRIG